MPVKTVLRMGDERLLQKSKPIKNITSPETADFLKNLYQDLEDTMLHCGGVGIAAPQIGVSVRVILFGFEKNVRYPDAPAIPKTFLINPQYKVLSDELVESVEGCLSVPTLRGPVKRYEKIEYSGYDLNGNEIVRTVEGFHARALQHECDHLDGILFPFKISDYSRFGYEDALIERAERTSH